MIKNQQERDKLLSMIADSIGAEIVKWDNVDDIIDKGISITKLVDTSSYISKEDNEKLLLKSSIY